ncbi:copper homeostasis protein [Ophiostoma piceae UAMH 11346]|uniref:Copper homeostasis protein cutC homolog n=1 Tax=Ophiostoma piceae (strain UAMH 11346) TaxID=1262450 RepID=S3C7Y5_OPHP1|nr:copper homeostasis protein [Ophiostoma piceae UAMH 11346]
MSRPEEQQATPKIGTSAPRLIAARLSSFWHHIPPPRPRSMSVFEIPVFSAAAAKAAVDNGATRLEINRAGSYVDGGLTPTLAEVKEVIDALGKSSVPLRVMVRPRGPPADSADFVYSDAEFQQMQADLQAFVASGLLSPERGDGFVFGILEKAETLQIDRQRNRQLVQAAGGYACVLHRAFDLVVDPAAPGETLGVAREIGFAGVLTAGGPSAQGAVGHVSTLQNLASAALSVPSSKGAIEIIVGGSVRSKNLQALADGILGTSAPLQRVAFHSSCLADSAAAVRDGAAGEAVDGTEVGRIQEIITSL